MVFQIGSLGDTVIALPCYREIARRHPGAWRVLLTNFPQTKMVQAEAILRPAGLVDECVEYPMPLRGRAAIVGLLRRVRALRIDVLYYLTPEKRVVNLARHWGFFKACGVGRVVGVPWRRDERFVLEVVPGVLWESEASRLLRCVVRGRGVGAPADGERRLGLLAAERAAAGVVLGEMGRFVAVSVGGKLAVNDWGDEHWLRVLGGLSARRPGLGLVLVGSGPEWERNERLARAWAAGPVVNACGRLLPRESGALLGRAAVFVGHDTGTLHLAAAEGTPVVGVYSARNVPGKWFSDRAGDRFFYEKVECFGCELERREDCPFGVKCMSGHRVEDVVAAVEARLDEVPGP